MQPNPKGKKGSGVMLVMQPTYPRKKLTEKKEMGCGWHVFCKLGHPLTCIIKGKLRFLAQSRCHKF